MLPTKISYDKLAHFFASTILLVALLFFMRAEIAYIIVIFSAIFKELYYDLYLGKGQGDFMDFVFSVLPILIHILS